MAEMSGCQDTFTTQLFYCTFLGGLKNSKQHLHITCTISAFCTWDFRFSNIWGSLNNLFIGVSMRDLPFPGSCCKGRWCLSPFLLLPLRQKLTIARRRSNHKWNECLIWSKSVFTLFSFLAVTLNCKLAYFGIEKFLTRTSWALLVPLVVIYKI